MCGVCVVCERCPLDGCDALIGQRSLENCTVTMSVYSTCVHKVVAQHSHESSKNFGMSVDIAWFPDFGHIVAGIFIINLANFFLTNIYYQFLFPQKNCFWAYSFFYQNSFFKQILFPFDQTYVNP